jgi:acetyl-CoA carboxylase carboxyl transferase subunit alpha
VVVSEGGSGGSLAIGVTDQLFMLENSIYSIISPEGFASILFKDSSKAKDAAELMKLTAYDLKNFQVCDGIIPEAEGGFQDDIPLTLKALDQHLHAALKALQKQPLDKLLKNRYKRFRSIGVYEEKKDNIV